MFLRDFWYAVPWYHEIKQRSLPSERELARTATGTTVR
jgi:hypothetical protein